MATAAAESVVRTCAPLHRIIGSPQTEVIRRRFALCERFCRWPAADLPLVGICTHRPFARPRQLDVAVGFWQDVVCEPGGGSERIHSAARCHAPRGN